MDTERKAYIVCGPPGSGKTTWVTERARPGDFIWDQDAVLRVLSGYPDGTRARGVDWRRLGVAARDALIASLQSCTRIPQVFIIVGGARRADREHLAQRLRAQIVVLDVPADECLRRIAAMEERRGTAYAEWQAAVDEWWATYEAGR